MCVSVCVCVSLSLSLSLSLCVCVCVCVLIGTFVSAKARTTQVNHRDGLGFGGWRVEVK